MITTTTPPLMTEDVQEHTVNTLKSYPWDRCVTLTYKYKTETPDTFLYLHNFIRRINGINQKKVNYWFGISPNRIGKESSQEWKEEEFIPVHIHGVMGECENLSNIDIGKCWRTTPVPYVNKESGIETIRPFRLGTVMVSHFDLNPDWFWYSVRQTPQGWFFTNIEELNQEIL